MSCSNPHNRKVAAVLNFTIRLASHLLLHPLFLGVFFSALGRFLEMSIAFSSFAIFFLKKFKASGKFSPGAFSENWAGEPLEAEKRLKKVILL